MTYQVGSVYTTTGTPAELETFIVGKSFIHDVNIVYSGTAGSYTVFIEADTNN